LPRFAPGFGLAIAGRVSEAGSNDCDRSACEKACEDR
jgi:hypothetical protein